MGALRKASAVLLCLSVMSQAQSPRAGTDPLALFATCAGRLSALIEHQWLIGQPADTTMTERDVMIGLLDAAVGADERGAAMALRVEAKVAEAGLLDRATFGPAEGRVWTEARAMALIRECRSLIAGPGA